MALKHAILCFALCIVTACGTDELESSGTASGGVNANDASVNADLARWEVPSVQSGNLFITHRTDDGQMNYCLEYDFNHNHSVWVAYRYDTKLKTISTSRTNAWAPDPKLNKYRAHQVAVGYFNGYQRGHLVGSAERYYSRQANEQTFYMSNMSPMNGAFNTTYWGEIEKRVRDVWGRNVAAGDTLYVVKGGTLDDNLGTIGVSNTLGAAIRVTVPRYYFMALLMYRSTTNVSAIGFWMENKDYGNTNPDFLSTLARDCSCTIDELEERTGLDFFCNLPDDIETRVEAVKNYTKWSGL